MDLYFGADRAAAWTLWIRRLTCGQVAILPTDTIYGLSANAWDARAVRRIGEFKRRRRSSTVIPHSTEWARSLVHPRARALFDRMWARCSHETLLLPFGPDRGVARPARELTQSGLIGLRLPRHWIGRLVRDAGVPLVSTSVNLSGQPHMQTLDDLPRGWKRRLDFTVFEGPLTGRPSAIHFYESGRLTRQER
ncbi:MAG: Sua5/YciO/YrdC/YwlC family protein [Deltaproteobacteria bacterium]|nr:Sua5/YciO/YrdC/YwlC family protein [Deltaproteobacteria bacterium]